jgi:hypothetical protein
MEEAPPYEYTHCKYCHVECGSRQFWLVLAGDIPEPVYYLWNCTACPLCKLLERGPSRQHPSNFGC